VRLINKPAQLDFYFAVGTKSTVGFPEWLCHNSVGFSHIIVVRTGHKGLRFDFPRDVRFLYFFTHCESHVAVLCFTLVRVVRDGRGLLTRLKGLKSDLILLQVGAWRSVLVRLQVGRPVVRGRRQSILDGLREHTHFNFLDQHGSLSLDWLAGVVLTNSGNKL